MKTLKQVMEIFDHKALRSAVSIYNALNRHGHKIEDLENYFKESQKAEEFGQEEWKAEVQKQIGTWEAVAPLCPTCGGKLHPPKHICKKKGPENIHGYTCLWHCENGNCIYEKYTYQNAAEEMKKLMERRKENAK